MEKFDIYQDVAKRTDGDIYVGVVGPVRTGKSTFVKKFAELMIMPNISGKNKKMIATDELPQSGAGKTVTTTEPKFIPSEAVKVSLKGKTHARMRLIDCVGFMVDGAIGHEENGEARMVVTPWRADPMPLEEAAETGTDKVISEHSTIGIVVTTDGSFTDIPRKNYIPAERKTIERLKKIGKPFVIVLNSSDPNGDAAKTTAKELEEEYGVSVVTMNAAEDGEEKYSLVMEKVLSEFPVRSIDVDLPDWLAALSPKEKVVSAVIEAVRACSLDISKMKDCEKLEAATAEVEKIIPEKVELFAGEGRAAIKLNAESSLFYDVLSETCGENIDGEYRLMSFIVGLKTAREEYAKLKDALSEVEETGYGIVLPTAGGVELGEPAVVKAGGRYEVRLTANAESLHLIKVGVKATINPISGTKEQCEEFIDFIGGENLAEAKVFGRPIGSLVGDEINRKAGAMPSAVKAKIEKSVSRMVNGGKYRVLYLVY